MDELFVYFMKSSGTLLLFLALYFLWLRKDTFFHGNRFFLLLGMIISLILPFLVITKYIEVPFVEETPNSGIFVFTETGNEVTNTFISWSTILFYTYVAGVLFFLSKFLIELASLCKLLWTASVTKRDGQFIYIETTTSFTPFSFFNYIVYNPELYSESELEAILIHEKAHSRQLHSIDVFIAKLYCIFMWFNPFAWLHQKYILQNLEFLADSAAIKQTPSKKEYQLTLLKVSGNAYCPALTNNFYNSLIKKRIVMLQKNQSAHAHKWKQVFILPLLVAFVLLFNTEVIAKEVRPTVAPILETIENVKGQETVGDLVVEISKNTTIEELKAIKKMFAATGIKMKYSNVDFNDAKEITRIKLELKEGRNNTASATFNTEDNKPIPTIRIGKQDGQLMVSSSRVNHVVTSTRYEYHTDEDHDKKDGKSTFIIKSNQSNGKGENTNTWIQKEDVKTVNIKKVDGKEVIIVNGKELAPDEIKTIDIKKNDDKEVIIINGKELSTDEVIEEEIEIKKGDGNNFVFIGNTKDNESKEVEIEVNNSQDGKIVFRNSGKNEPIIVVDGKIANKKKMKKLDPNKIESVTVLKGDNATALYGDKGKDGVIIITTKKK
ncbi:M56 family metallopeptidase [Kordia jejudonensis]|uniref:M56 family metallopeptidase n=1 Tax=Kordia jejudonensis TaxID=1348245 RepID=UPI00069BF2FC|nr:M56 family metallopeptidase [Kordia jejudonensis]